MKHFLCFLFLLVLCSVVVLGEWDSYRVCTVNDTCTVNVFTVVKDDADTLLNVTNCTLTVFNSTNFSNTVLNGVNMPRVSTGSYSYSVNLTESGFYPSYVKCVGSNAHIMSGGNPVSDGDTKDVSFVVVDEVQSNYWMLAVLLPILCVIGMFAYFSIRMDKIHYFIKVLLFLASISLSIVAVNIGRLLVEEYSPASLGLVRLLNVASFVLIIFLIVVTAYLIIYYIAELLWGIAKTKIGKTP